MLRRLLIAGTATALLDGLFSSVLAAFFYGSSVTRLFKGVAVTVFGPDAPAWVGVLMHIDNGCILCQERPSEVAPPFSVPF